MSASLARPTKPLLPKLKDGTFREDLYYRLAVIPIEIPPLRERLEDVPLLVNHFLQKQAAATGGEAEEDRSESSRYSLSLRLSRKCPRIGKRDRASLCLVRERYDFAERIFRRTSCRRRTAKKRNRASPAMPVGETLDDFIQQQERGYIEATLAHCGGSREKAASMLGISMATLYRKVEPKKK